MKYLVIAVRNTANGFDAYLYTRTNAFFDLVEEKTQDLPTITEDNYNVIDRGKIVSENINEMEPTMRKIGFRKCDECGAWCTPQDIRAGLSTWDGEKRLCQLCKAKKREPRYLPLYGYHDTSRYARVINGEDENFVLSNVLGIGIEVEFYNEHSNSQIKCTDTFYEQAKDMHSRDCIWRCERDCTVSGEIISNVFTKKSLYAYDFSIITDEIKLNGNIEGNTKAGLHVHFSKTWLGDTPKEQSLNFLKLQYFMKSYEHDFLKLCGRNPDYMDYCRFFSHGEIQRMKERIMTLENPWGYMPSSHGGGVGCALNASGCTIEYRIGANTNDPERMTHYLRFLLGIVENIKNVNFNKCYCLRKVTKLVPQETMQYWRKQGCFLNTNAINERGVTL